jgi:hypothetical protein
MHSRTKAYLIKMPFTIIIKKSHANDYDAYSYTLIVNDNLEIQEHSSIHELIIDPH